MAQHHDPLEHPITRCARELSAVLDAVVGADPLYLSTRAKADALLELTSIQTRVESLRLSVIATAGDVAAEGADPNVASWLGPRTKTRPGGNHRDERLAKALRTRWTQVAAALEAGEISRAQAEVVVAALDALGSDLDADLLARCEEHLVGLCARFGPADLRRAGRKVLEVVAPDLYDDEERKRLEEEERRANAQTRLSLRKRGDGTVDIKGRISEHVAARLRSTLNAYTSPRRRKLPDIDHHGRTKVRHPGGNTGSDGGDAGEKLGPAIPLVDPATGAKVPFDQRLGQAFEAFLEGVDPDQVPLHGGGATTLVITMQLTDLVNATGAATLPDGERISATQARRLACTAHLVPAVLGTDGQVLDLGRASRLFTPAQRRALAVTQPTCRAVGCEVPANWCEAHHWRRPWAAGGTTDLDDGKLLCPWHHHRAHDPGYHVEHHPDGSVRFHQRT